jgi:hypothetical protein
MSTVAVTFDYSNGTQKHFSSIPWSKGLTILDAIEATRKIAPASSVTFGSDRDGHVLGLVVDGIPEATGGTTDWSVWVNAKPVTNRLGTPTSFGFNPGEREDNLVNAGDRILLKLVSKPAS